MQNDDRMHEDRMNREPRVSLGDNDSMRTQAQGGLAHLDDLDDFKIAEGEPDIRGWDVRGADGQKLGKVEDLLVDTAAMKVRYIEVKLEKDIAREMGSSAGTSASPTASFGDRDVTPRPSMSADTGRDNDDERYVLVPIGVARLDDDKDDVLLDAQATQMAGIPAYHRNESVTRDYESHVLRGYASNAGSPMVDSTFGNPTISNPSGGSALGTQTGSALGDADLISPNLPPADRSAASPSDDFYTGRTFDDRSFFGGRRRGRDDESYFSRGSKEDAEHGGINQRRMEGGRDVRDRDLLDSPSDLDRDMRDEIRDRTR